jgi:hypothetical protein
MSFVGAAPPLNIADTPHFDLIQTNRRLGYGLYETRAR